MIDIRDNGRYADDSSFVGREISIHMDMTGKFLFHHFQGTIPNLYLILASFQINKLRSLSNENYEPVTRVSLKNWCQTVNCPFGWEIYRCDSLIPFSEPLRRNTRSLSLQELSWRELENESNDLLFKFLMKFFLNPQDGLLLGNAGHFDHLHYG